MYKNFFGFRERPFKLVPNPTYLYLGRSHEEALAHLTYAVSEGDGFVEITGEVGTGKTTLCRAFLEGLDENAKTAYIFNPKLDSIQLLKAINDEFGIDSRADNTKDLIDAMNAFLMEKKREGKNVILLIDEAQNLSRDVLEQLRLLSNLETTRDKLLQIILVGQPELGEMLDSPDLRQLNQRITVSCHLRPLDQKETREYIHHRLNVASVKETVVFTQGAVNAAYRYSGGIPRKINIVCDRSLLTAFGLDQKIVRSSTVRAAIRELSGKENRNRFFFLKEKGKVGVLVMSGLIAAAIIFYLPSKLDVKSMLPAKELAKKTPVDRMSSKAPVTETVIQSKSVEKEKPKEPVPVLAKPDEKSLIDHLKELISKDSRRTALAAAMERWGIKGEINPFLAEVSPDPEFFRLAASQNGFLIQHVVGNMDLVRKLNLPAVLVCNVPEVVSPVYLAVCHEEKGVLTLKSAPDDSGFAVKKEDLVPFYSGSAYILWKNFFGYEGVLPLGTSENTMIALKMHVREIGYDDITMDPIYDENTKKIIKSIQKNHGLPDDGLIGPLTKIILYNEIDRLKTPKLGIENP